MHPRDMFLATLVALIWGPASWRAGLALDDLPPPLMTTLRIGIAALPCLFVRKPDVSWPQKSPRRACLAAIAALETGDNSG